MKGIVICTVVLMNVFLCVEATSRQQQLSILKMAGGPEVHHHKQRSKSNEEIINNLKKDAENQKAIMASKRASSNDDSTEAHSMSPHLSMHSTRGEEAEGRGRSRAREHKRVQKSIHGELVLPPDEATPFFDTYVLKYAFPTIAIICSCLACVLYRTMRMYQKERWKGTSYFHGARRSAESLLPGLK